MTTHSSVVSTLVLLLLIVALPPVAAQSPQEALFEAARKGQVQLLRAAAAEGADVNARDSDGYAALHYAAAWDERATVRELISLGADIEVRDRAEGGWSGSTALIHASVEGHTLLVRELLDEGAEVNARTSEGQTALMAAAYNGRSGTVKTLLAAGAVVNSQDQEGLTALMYAAINGHADLVETLLDAFASLNTVGDAGNALHVAAELGNGEIAQVLIQRGANVDLGNGYGQTSLMLAAQGGHGEVVRLLLEAGADPHRVDADGDSALGYYAAAHGHDDIVRQLIDAGADVHATNASGQNPLSFAVETGHDEIAEVLRSQGASTVPTAPAVDLAALLPTASDIGADGVNVQDLGDATQHRRVFDASPMDFEIGSSSAATLLTQVQSHLTSVEAVATVELLASMPPETVADVFARGAAVGMGFDADSAWVSEAVPVDIGDAAMAWTFAMATPIGEFCMTIVNFARFGISGSVVGLGGVGEINVADIEAVALSIDERILAHPMSQAASEPLAEGALESVQEGVKLVLRGQVEEAVEAFDHARTLDARIQISAEALNTLCWFGSLWGRADLVLAACNEGVSVSGGEAYIRDSRGVARSVMGDFPGAIEDFEVWVAAAADGEGRDQRLSWISALQSGENPITESVLAELLAPQIEAMERERRIIESGYDFAELLPSGSDITDDDVVVNDAPYAQEGAEGAFVRELAATDPAMFFTLGESQVMTLVSTAALYDSAETAEAVVREMAKEDVGDLALRLLEAEGAPGVSVEATRGSPSSLGDAAVSLGGIATLGVFQVRFLVYVFAVGPVTVEIVVVSTLAEERLEDGLDPVARMTVDRLKARAGG